jgi:hypothetical protein
VLGLQVFFERVGVGEDLVEVEASRELGRLVGNKRDAAWLTTVLSGQFDDDRPKLVGMAGLGLENRQHWHGPGSIDAGTDDNSTRGRKGNRCVLGHSVTRVPGSTIRTAVSGANRVAAFS